jgi:hypothetical protein
MRFCATDEVVMNAATPSLFPVLPPQVIPAMASMRSQIDASLLAALADYATRAATLGHLEAAAALQALCERLPLRDPTAATKPVFTMPAGADTLLADDAAHDRYFHVRRVAQAGGTAFLRSILMAAGLFHAEMASVYAPLDALRFASMGAGFGALLGAIGGIRVAPVEHTAAGSCAVPATVDPMRRWVLGHQIFATLTQGIIFALQEFEIAARAPEPEPARAALKLATDLLMASATAFRFTGDFAPAAYRDLVRPSMMPPREGEGFSGLLSIDHRQLVAMLVRTRPLMGETAVRFAPEHQRLADALNHVYEDHKFVCAQFDGAKKPSLRCPRSSPLPGVEQLDRYQRARVGLLYPNVGMDTIIVE